jgi:hypothetical protein
MKEPLDWINIELVTGYETDDPQLEFYRRIEEHLGALGIPDNELNRCTSLPCNEGNNIDRALSRLARMRGSDLSIFTDAALVRIIGDSDTDGQVFTLILNKGYKNLTSIFSNEDNRERNDDTLSIVRGIVGAYPNFFFHVTADQIDRFVDDLSSVHSREDYENIVAKYGVRRTDVEFWKAADWFQETYSQLEPIESGILDLNRYRNR